MSTVAHETQRWWAMTPLLLRRDSDNIQTPKMDLLRLPGYRGTTRTDTKGLPSDMN